MRPRGEDLKIYLHRVPIDMRKAEIIEHLENPRHFLRECGKLLKPGGEILLTTPNAGSPVSKAFLPGSRLSS